MEHVTDWLTLWRQLAEIQSCAFDRKRDVTETDCWKHKAKQYDTMIEKRWSKPDSSRQFIAADLQANPGSTLLDIGAGTGAWSEYLAPYAKEVTALEPSAAMGERLTQKIDAGGIQNVKLVEGSWPEIEIESHDFLLASHSMYGIRDFQGFIQKMVTTARKRCYLVLRVLYADSIMAKASRRILGQPYDSPCFQIAYNALLQMDIYPNVLMETGRKWDSWSNESIEAALEQTKNRLGIHDTTVHDEYLSALLTEGLIKKEDRYVWPVGNRSALVYWDV